MTQNLSPAMVASMWLRYEIDNANGLMTGSLFVRAQRERQATADALCARGLVEWQGGQITDAGRAWIVEQIEAAHVEALWENLNRALIVEENLNQYPQTERAERMLFLAGIEQVGLMVAADLVNQDAELAWKMHRYAYNIRNAQSVGHHQQEQQIAMDAGFNLGDLARIARSVNPNIVRSLEIIAMPREMDSKQV